MSCDFCTKSCGNKHCHTNNKKTYIDPPSGWKYGFPKVLPEGVKTNEQIKDWLKKEGYPVKDLDFALKYSRYWER